MVDLTDKVALATGGRQYGELSRGEQLLNYLILAGLSLLLLYPFLLLAKIIISNSSFLEGPGFSPFLAAFSGFAIFVFGVNAFILGVIHVVLLIPTMVLIFRRKRIGLLLATLFLVLLQPTFVVVTYALARLSFSMKQFVGDAIDQASVASGTMPPPEIGTQFDEMISNFSHYPLLFGSLLGLQILAFIAAILVYRWRRFHFVPAALFVVTWVLFVAVDNLMFEILSSYVYAVIFSILSCLIAYRMRQFDKTISLNKRLESAVHSG